MKKIILYISILLTISIAVYSINECKGVIEPDDIPCLVISPYRYDNACNTYTVNVYDNTPTLLNTFTMGDYGITGRCNITFNYTERGSYLLDISSGDTGSINVEGYKMEFINITIFVLFFGLAMVFLNYMHKYKEDEGSCIVYGILATTLLVLLGSLISFGFEVLTLDIDLVYDINYYIAAICFVFSIYTGYYSFAVYQVGKPKERGKFD